MAVTYKIVLFEN